jgi:hypothetical protein
VVKESATQTDVNLMLMVAADLFFDELEAAIISLKKHD